MPASVKHTHRATHSAAYFCPTFIPFLSSCKHVQISTLLSCCHQLNLPACRVYCGCIIFWDAVAWSEMSLNGAEYGGFAPRTVAPSPTETTETVFRSSAALFIIEAWRSLKGCGSPTTFHSLRAKKTWENTQKNQQILTENNKEKKRLKPGRFLYFSFSLERHRHSCKSC